MKKLFCVLTALCLLASVVAVGTMSVAATKEQDEQILVGGEPTATTPAVKIPQFRVVTAKVRPFTTPDKYVNPDDYAAVRAEYVVWFFNDERGEERYLFAKAATPREEVTYWLPGKNPDYSTIDHTDEQWYEHIVFEIPGKTVVGLPDDAECVTDWYYYGESEYKHAINEASLRNSIEAKIAMQNNEDVENGASVAGAPLVNPYLELGGFYDLDNDGIAEEVGWDYNGDGITEIVAIGVDPTATHADLVLRGDITADGVVNMKDVLMLRAFLCGHVNFNKAEKVWVYWDMNPNRPKKIVSIDESNADANADGEINMKDVLAVRKYLAGIISAL